MKPAQGGSRVILMADGHNCNDFKEPSSLKDLLAFFDALNGTEEVKKKVLEELKNRLTGGDKKNGWVRDDIDFSLENANNGNGSGSMSEAIKGLKELREKILNGNGKNTNPYTLPDESNAATDPCIKKYADAIIQNAFPLFGCLFYLWFMCVDENDDSAKGSGDNHKLKNGTLWENGTGPDKDLNKFLTDQQPEKGNGNKVPMLPRGYKNENELNQSKQGKELFKNDNDNGKMLFRLNCSGGTGNGPGNFQQALFFLLFLAPRWCHAMSGHALLFLDWFNNNAKDTFQDVQWLHVKMGNGKFFENCTKLSKAIQKLAGNGGTGVISPVYIDSIGTNRCNLYSPKNGNDSKGNGHTGAKTILHNDESFNNDPNGHKKAHVFMQYVSWLWWCIPHLTASLRAMSADSKKWQKENFTNSNTFGPFAFGFTFPCRYHITCMT